MAVLMTATLYCMLGSMGATRLLDILARLYIFFSVFFVILWYEEEKDYSESGLLCRTDLLFLNLDSLCSSPRFTVVLAAWATSSICNIWSGIVFEKEDNFVTVCVLCTLLLWSLIIVTGYCYTGPWCRFTCRCVVGILSNWKYMWRFLE